MNEVFIALAIAWCILALYFYMENKAARRENTGLRRDLASYEDEEETILNDSDEDNAERFRRLEAMLGIIKANTEFLMPAIDDLKTAITALITEGTSDIAALVAKINAQSNQDPAIVALTTQVTDATAAMHSAFNAATGFVDTSVVSDPAAEPAA